MKTLLILPLLSISLFAADVIPDAEKTSLLEAKLAAVEAQAGLQQLQLQYVQKQADAQQKITNFQTLLDTVGKKHNCTLGANLACQPTDKK